MPAKRTYTLKEIQTLLANLDNGIPGTQEKEMRRIKLPIPIEFGGGWATGATIDEAVVNLLVATHKPNKPKSDAPEFKDYAERWFLIKKGEKKAESTIRNYRTLLDKKIIPALGKKPIDLIKYEDIQKYFNSILKLSRSVSTQSRSILNGIFELAERNEIIDKNPMRFKYEISKKVGKKVVLQDKDLINVIEKLELLNGEDYIYACFLCFTALRRGEILGLKWGDLDFEKQEIHVRRGVSFPDGDNPPVVDLPKDGSTGTVYLNGELAKRIRKYCKSPSTYVFSYSRKEPGRPITRSMFTKMWYRIRKTIDLKGATSHSFRASYATMMNAHCTHIDPKALQGALRHKTPDLAIKVYTKENTNKTRLAEMEYEAWLKSQIAT